MNKHIITDEEAERAWEIYMKGDGPTMVDDMRKALSDFLNNRPQVAQLRPIAEMPETVPEGCFRVFYGRQFSADPNSPWQVKDADQRCNGVNPATHFQDIQLPTPGHEAEERQRFEKWWSKYKLSEEGYDGDEKELHMFEAWKASKQAK